MGAETAHAAAPAAAHDAGAAEGEAGDGVGGGAVGRIGPCRPLSAQGWYNPVPNMATPFPSRIATDTRVIHSLDPQKLPNA